MGIPVYFNTLIKNYSDNILYLNKQKINYLFLDLNCLIHPTCKNLTDQNIFNEEQMIDDIIRNILKLIEYTNTDKLLYIAIDGIPPKGKMIQQRKRRFSSNDSNNKQWNSNCISPGTKFMNKLNNKLHEFIKTININVILSDSNERGEGEHKILSYIRNNNLDGTISIYGLDADLIMLSLVSRCNNILLLRETTEYNIENTNTDYIYLNIDNLKAILLKEIGYDKPHIIDDYIFLCFLLGNDFIHHIPSLNLRYNGYHILINTYKKLQYKYHGYFQLINRDNDNIIYKTSFKELIYELSILEEDILKKNHDKRKYQRVQLLKKYNPYINDFKKEYMNEISNEKLTIQNVNDYKNVMLSHFPLNKDIIDSMINDLPLLLLNDSSDNYYVNKSQDIYEYLKSIIWCTHYYFKECIDWRWAPECNRAPFLEDLNIFLKDNNDYEISYNEDNEYNYQELLEFILPHNDNKIHIYKTKKNNYDLIIDMRHKKYLWECDIDFKQL